MSGLTLSRLPRVRSQVPIPKLNASRCSGRVDFGTLLNLVLNQSGQQYHFSPLCHLCPGCIGLNSPLGCPVLICHTVQHRHGSKVFVESASLPLDISVSATKFLVLQAPCELYAPENTLAPVMPEDARRVVASWPLAHGSVDFLQYYTTVLSRVKSSHRTF
jgi:hypothetical protein